MPPPVAIDAGVVEAGVAQRDPDGDDDPSDAGTGTLPASGRFVRVGRAPLALQRICDLTPLGDALYASRHRRRDHTRKKSPFALTDGMCAAPLAVFRTRSTRAARPTARSTDSKNEAVSSRAMMILHQFEISPFCDKIRRVLSFKRIPYEIREMPLTGAIKLKKLNPAGKLPCLEHEGRFIADSTDIAQYLDDKFPERPVIPTEKRLRGQCHAIEEWADESLFFLECYFRFTIPHNAKRWIPEMAKGQPAIVRTAAMGFVPMVMKRRLAAQGLGLKSREQVDRDLARHVEALDDLLDGTDWLVGDRLTLADIAVFAQMFCVRAVEEGARFIEAKPRVAAWMDRVDGATRERHRVAA